MSETLSWDDAVNLYGESRHLPGGGFRTRLHAVGNCPERITTQPMAFRAVVSAPAENMCPVCTSELVACSYSSAVVALRDLERILERAIAHQDTRASMVTVSSRARALDSVHPDFTEAQARVLSEAERLMEILPIY